MKFFFTTICILCIGFGIAEASNKPFYKPSTELRPTDRNPRNTIAGVKILMANDPNKRIENIRVGDIVLAYDIKLKKHVLSQVQGVEVEKRSDLMRYTFSNQVEIIASPDHPFLQHTLQWSSIKPSKTELFSGYTNVQTLKVGDEILQLGTTTQLVKVEPVVGEYTTFTITKLSVGDAFFANGCAVGTEGAREQLLVKKAF